MSAAFPSASIDLFWLPLGAGGQCVRFNGRVFERIAARREHRPVCDLYHCALQVQLGEDRFVVEMTPAWGNKVRDRGVVCEGPVGSRLLGRSRFFRYEVRCWRNGVIPDLAEAVGGRRRLSTDLTMAQELLDLVPTCPANTWGRDELGAGDMWNSNSLAAWLLASTGHDMDTIGPPLHGRAPGWSAGLVLAAREGHLAVR